MHIAVIGAGAWGTTLANLLAAKGHHTVVWVRETDLAQDMRDRRENTVFLPGITLHKNLAVETELPAAMAGAEAFVFVVPCQFSRAVLRDMLPHLPERPVLVCANKGIEVERLATVSDMVFEELAAKSPRFAMLSGPTFASEVSRSSPTAIVLGCDDEGLGTRLQHAFSTEAFRVYTNPDYRGVELGGAVKNVMAIAAGIADGLNFGHNARAALITRGLAEMGRLGAAMGANQRTFMGLAGLGDLVLTCTGDLSRNRQVGLKIGQGQSLDQIVNSMKMVAEGVKTTQALHALGRKLEVELPITDQVYATLYEGKNPAEAVRDLMTRELKRE